MPGQSLANHTQILWGIIWAGNVFEWELKNVSNWQIGITHLDFIKLNNHQGMSDNK